MKFIKISFAVLTACLTIGSLSSFRNMDATTWYYNGAADPDQFNLIGNWSEEEAPGVTCGDDLDIPCQTNQEMTENQLETLLANNPGEDLFAHVSKRDN